MLELVNKMKKILILSIAVMMSAFTQAQVTIQTDNRVEVLAVNQTINKVPNKGKGHLKIANGDNQLLIRVTAMVDGNGGKTKFNSLPMVIRFHASDQTLDLTTPFAIRTERAVKKFAENPLVSVTSDGEDWPYIVDVIHDQTFELLKDYNAMLMRYNQTKGKAALVSAGSNNRFTTVEQSESSTNSTELNRVMETAFFEMTPSQRQQFLAWAVQHLND
ncbi:hypothetical protein VSVS05_02040 [Vibrio scophthalmi]|uniref:Uncharacterized protein n=2 Tax=Vibrio scophthalmi TaxID=45658 RepID=A0A1C7FCR7_9VIBR|nr:hypothetical protein VSVS05_02040 [Vibrio scophthalmi]